MWTHILEGSVDGWKCHVPSNGWFDDLGVQNAMLLRDEAELRALRDTYGSLARGQQEVSDRIEAALTMYCQVNGLSM